MIPSYQSLMKPVLVCAKNNEVRIKDVIDQIADNLKISDEEKNKLLPSGKQTFLANRIQWATTYLFKAGLIHRTRRGYFVITDRGKQALSDPNIQIDNQYLKQFKEFQDFQNLSSSNNQADNSEIGNNVDIDEVTPDEVIRTAYRKINSSLQTDILDRIRSASSAFFESVIIDLLLGMGYGGAIENAGRTIGQTGDDGVDGVIDQDPLGVDQIYIQAKRYADGNNISSSHIRDFFGALNLKKAQKGIFITTSKFTASAIKTAESLSNRIVLIDGIELSKLMLKNNIGCKNQDTLYLKKIDEDFFE